MVLVGPSFNLGGATAPPLPSLPSPGARFYSEGDRHPWPPTGAGAA